MIRRLLCLQNWQRCWNTFCACCYICYILAATRDNTLLFLNTQTPESFDFKEHWTTLGCADYFDPDNGKVTIIRGWSSLIYCFVVWQMQPTLFYFLLQNNSTAAPSHYTASAVCVPTTLLYSLAEQMLISMQLPDLNKGYIYCIYIIYYMAKVPEGVYISVKKGTVTVLR